LRRSGHLLAELHERLHRISAPPGIRVAPLPGDRLVHRDLHPLNVMMTPEGPMIIDWANASAGDPAFDVADTWVLFSCGTPPMGGIDRLTPIGRRIFLRAFLILLDSVQQGLDALQAPLELCDPRVRCRTDSHSPHRPFVRDRPPGRLGDGTSGGLWATRGPTCGFLDH